MNLSKYLYLLLIVGVLGCKSQAPVTNGTTDALTKAIGKKLGAEYRSVNNTNNTYVLAWKEDNSSGTRVVRYGVWIAESAKLLYAGSAINGKVEWLDNESLLVEDYPGIVDGDNQIYKFKIDLKTKTKIPLHEKEDL